MRGLCRSMFEVFQKTSTILLPGDFVRDLASLLFQFTKGPASPRFHLRSSGLREAFLIFLFKRHFDPKVRPKIRKGSLKGIFAIDICHCDPEGQGGVRCNLSRINTCWVLHDPFFSQQEWRSYCMLKALPALQASHHAPLHNVLLQCFNCAADACCNENIIWESHIASHYQKISKYQAQKTLAAVSHLAQASIWARTAFAECSNQIPNLSSSSCKAGQHEIWGWIK